MVVLHTHDSKANNVQFAFVKLLPWDLNIRMQVPESEIFFLAAYYNMSTFRFKGPDMPKRRKYMLQLSPYSKDRVQADPRHPADARWIDTESGLSLEVYAVRYNLSHPGGEGMLSCKDGSDIMVWQCVPAQVGPS